MDITNSKLTKSVMLGLGVGLLSSTMFVAFSRMLGSSSGDKIEQLKTSLI